MSPYPKKVANAGLEGQVAPPRGLASSRGFGLTQLDQSYAGGCVSAYGAALIAGWVSLGNASFDSQAQLFLTKRTGTVQPPYGHRSDSLIVILYVGYIRYQSGEGRLSDEVVDQLGKEPIAEDELPSPATVSSLSRKR